MNKPISQEKGQRTADLGGRSKDEILSMPGVSVAEDFLERGWHCKVCQLELTAIEKILYGEHCILHTTQKLRKFSLISSLQLSYLDWRIYHYLLKLREIVPGDPYYYIVGILGTLGLQHIGAAYSVFLKKMLIKEIKGVVKDAKAGKIQKLRGGSEYSRGEETREQTQESQAEESADFSSQHERHAEISRLRHNLAQR